LRGHIRLNHLSAPKSEAGSPKEKKNNIFGLLVQDF